MDAISNAYVGKDAKTGKRYDSIFNLGFKAGARARVVSVMHLHRRPDTWRENL